MKSLIKKLFQYIYSQIKPVPNSILILESAFPSASNTHILKRNSQKFEDAGFTISVMPYNQVRVENGGLKAYIKHIKIMREVSQYEFVFVTHSFQKYNRKQFLIDFWHGIPLKAMKFMELDEVEVNRPLSNADILVTSSKMESTLMNASFHLPFIKHRIIGSPRNDYLLQNNTIPDSLNFLESFNKVIMYIPTFRQGYFDRVEGTDYGTLFNMESFDTESFSEYLKLNNILLITKYHPREAKLRNYHFDLSSNIFNLTNDFLEESELDLYEVLKFADILVTDYSSIYFDYLLLDKPIIFTPTDLDTYRMSRGFVLEPYDFWTPGVKTLTQESLEREISLIISGVDGFKTKREELKSVFHRYTDGQSVERLIQVLNEIR